MSALHDVQTEPAIGRCAVCGCEVYDDGEYYVNGSTLIHSGECAWEFIHAHRCAEVMEMFGYQDGAFCQPVCAE